MESILKVSSPATQRAVTIRLNKPTVKNALGPEELEVLHSLLLECEHDPIVSVVTITGTGDAFCSGADINSLNSLSGDSLNKYLEMWTDVLLKIVSMPKVVIVAVNGVSAGGGNHMAVCADLCVATPDASFNFVGATKGIPSMELGTFLIPLSIGLKRAKWILLRGGRISASEAVQFGLCNQIVTRDSWDDQLVRLANEFASQASGATAHTKYVLNQGIYQMIGALKLSTIAGGSYLSNRTDIAPGRVKKGDGV